MISPAFKTLAVSTFIALTTASCGGDGTVQQGGTPSHRTDVKNATASRTGSSQGQPMGNPAAGQTVPAGAQYSLFIHAYSGPTHIPDAKNAKDALIKQTGLPDFHVIIKDGKSELCYGFYREVMPDKDPKEAARLESDKQKLLAFRTASDQHMIPAVTTVALAVPDPEAPPEWNVVNSKGYWTVCIAGYNNPQTRKADAIESVRAARQQGIEAYYFHGENTSNVLIGSFDRTALRQQDHNEVKPLESSGDVFISTGSLSEAEVQRIKRAKPGMEVVRPVVDIRDPNLLQLLKTYPEYALNGNVEMQRVKDPRTGKSTAIPQPSFLVEIPQVQKSWISGTRQNTAEPNPQLINPTNRNTGGGTLRRIDESSPIGGGTGPR